MAHPKTIHYHDHPVYKPIFIYSGEKDTLTTISILLDKDDGFKPKLVGVTVKSKQDKSNFRMAREISFGRALKNPMYTLNKDTVVANGEIKNILRNNFIEYKFILNKILKANKEK